MKCWILGVGFSVLAVSTVALADPIADDGGSGVPEVLKEQQQVEPPTFGANWLFRNDSEFRAAGITEMGGIYGTVQSAGATQPYFLAAGSQSLEALPMPDAAYLEEIRKVRDGAGVRRALLNTSRGQFVTEGSQIAAVPPPPSGHRLYEFDDINSWGILIGTGTNLSTGATTPMVAIGGRTFRFIDLLDRSVPQPNVQYSMALRINDANQLLLQAFQGNRATLALATPTATGFRVEILPIDLLNPMPVSGFLLNNAGEVAMTRTISENMFEHRVVHFVWSPVDGIRTAQLETDTPFGPARIVGFSDGGEVLLSIRELEYEVDYRFVHFNSRTGAVADIQEAIQLDVASDVIALTQTHSTIGTYRLGNAMNGKGMMVITGRSENRSEDPVLVQPIRK
ncbi:MAG: hypothetical protein QY326_00490 [Bdellovibrionota bacterium]|nr:MAG: hypothetical protein QY326_00490 [Bdellovibrionota bacterium]